MLGGAGNREANSRDKHSQVSGIAQLLVTSFFSVIVIDHFTTLEIFVIFLSLLLMFTLIRAFSRLEHPHGSQNLFL
uniref:DUF4010 domain-containing protein n=1 Tax=Steinernema glaseri TaxID=37863 RepID=A0A1I7YQ26_9BILA